MSLVALRKGRKDGEELSELCTFSAVRHRLPTVSASIKENKTDTCPVSDTMIPPKRLGCGWLNNREKRELGYRNILAKTKAYNASLTNKGPSWSPLVFSPLGVVLRLLA